LRPSRDAGRGLSFGWNQREEESEQKGGKTAGE
jgi:hypothetical protein